MWLFFKGKKEEKKASLEKEIKSLKTENEELKKQIALRDSTTRKNGITYYSDGTPICPVCTQNNPAIPVTLNKNDYGWHCPNKHFYEEHNVNNKAQRTFVPEDDEDPIPPWIV